MIASCWKSFSPNTATSGRTAANSLRDDGRHAAEVAGAGRALHHVGERVRARRAVSNPGGYIAAAVGA